MEVERLSRTISMFKNGRILYWLLPEDYVQQKIAFFLVKCTYSLKSK